MGLFDPPPKRVNPISAAKVVKTIVSDIPRGSNRRSLREKQMLSVNLREEFKTIKLDAFISYCLAAFGLRISRQTCYNHKKKPFSELKEHWKLKYLAFFHSLR